MNKLLSTPAARLGDTELSLGRALRTLKHSGRLQALLHGAIRQEFLLDEARKSGVKVATAELQAAANAFRRRRGLVSAEQTRSWLERTGITVDDFESNLERGLLVQKLKHFVTEPRLQNHFAQHRARYDLVKLQQIVVPREDLARELLMQLREEDRPFAKLVHQYPSANGQQDVPAMMRWQFPAYVTQAISSAKEGDVVGPSSGPRGFHLFLVESIRPATLDARTTARVRQEIFDAWLTDRLKNTPVALPLLDLL